MHLQMNGKLSEGEHGGIADVHIVISHAMIYVLQQWFQQPVHKHTQLMLLSAEMSK